MIKKTNILMLGFTLAVVSSSLLLTRWGGNCNTADTRADHTISESRPEGWEASPNLNTGSGGMKSPELKVANKLYNQGKYDSALVIYESMLELYLQEKRYFEDESKLELVYLMLARCKARLGDLEEAQEELRTVIEQTRAGKFSQNMGARMQLEIGNLYLQKKDYLTALEEFEKVLVTFSDTKYAQFASENIKKIDGWKVSEIKGLAILQDQSNHRGIDVTLFNGESLIRAQTDSEGAYVIPVFKSTPGTYVSIFLAMKNYVPQIKNVALTNEGVYSVPKVILSEITKPKYGVLAGVVFTPVIGGETKPQFGISKYARWHQIGVSSEDNSNIYSTESDENGIYILILPEGGYLLTSGWMKDTDILIKRGMTRIQNIGSAPLLID